MELIERDEFLELLQTEFKKVGEGEGHCIFVIGEAGLGKTSLIKAFCKDQKDSCKIYLGACDALFTPRPLAPLYDIMWQVNPNLWPANHSIEERSALFAAFFRELRLKIEKTIIVFEDIHWADEATLDFIKFFARRIRQLRCLFILTYRDNEIISQHPLRNVLGQLPRDSFKRIQLTPLSKQAVEVMARERGYKGEDVYSISGGNPFYVNEILSSYSTGIPDNIKDSIISVYNRQPEKTRKVWELLSVVPASLEIRYLEKFEPSYASVLEYSIESEILIVSEGRIYFKHELFRRTIETFLSPLKRIILNKKMLDLLLESNSWNKEVERIIHHAKNANEYETVVHYAPLAARQSASLGSHIEASKLYLTAIEYYQGNDKSILIQFYESYAYECYLTNQIKEAIIYTAKSLNIWKEENDEEKVGNSLRFLSRLWWFEGNGKKAASFGTQAVEILSELPSSISKAMAFSNMAQLKMLSDKCDECLSWGEKAIEIAKELHDDETICQSLNSMGSVLMLVESSVQKGITLLQQSMEIALKNSYQEHVARAYIELGSNAIIIKDYRLAGKKLDEGIKYCEKQDLDSMKLYMLSWKARLQLETGFWDEAYTNAANLLKNENLLPVIKISALTVLSIIKMRRGDDDALPLMLEAKFMAFETLELQRIVPILFALLEYEWITGKTYVETEDLDKAINMMREVGKISKKSKFYFWLSKARKRHPNLEEIYRSRNEIKPANPLKEAEEWKNLGCPYEQALALFEGSAEDKKKAITIVKTLKATAVYEKFKLEMRASGLRGIPRGINRTTLSNPAFLTSRELDVLQLLKEGLQNKEIGNKLFISSKTVDHHISSIFFKLEVNSRIKAVAEATRLEIIK